MMTNTSTMFLLTVPSCDDDKPGVNIGLFVSDSAAHEYMKQFQTVWVFRCEQFRNHPTEANGPFITVASSAEEILARYPGKNIKVYGKDGDAYKMDRDDVEDGFWHYTVTPIPVIG